MADLRIQSIAGKGIVVGGDDIDTDRIIPARFLKEITFANLGRFPFYDERFKPDLSQTNHPFNDPSRRDAKILFVNKNFGCGSSREHAPQSLKRWGIDAIVGESFAEIFASNCITLGIPAVTVGENDAKKVQSCASANADLIWTVNLKTATVSCRELTVDFHMQDHHRNTLIDGLWDSTSLLLENMSEVQKVYQKLPYTQNYRT